MGYRVSYGIISSFFPLFSSPLPPFSLGLNVALVEKDDFASGTSSRSTKLIHGGVRYLQKAIMGLDYEQYRLVREALHERANLLEIAPHLSHPLPIMLPIYKYVLHRNMPLPSI